MLRCEVYSILFLCRKGSSVCGQVFVLVVGIEDGREEGFRMRADSWRQRGSGKAALISAGRARACRARACQLLLAPSLYQRTSSALIAAASDLVSYLMSYPVLMQHSARHHHASNHLCGDGQLLTGTRDGGVGEQVLMVEVRPAVGEQGWKKGVQGQGDAGCREAAD